MKKLLVLSMILLAGCSKGPLHQEIIQQEDAPIVVGTSWVSVKGRPVGLVSGVTFQVMAYDEEAGVELMPDAPAVGQNGQLQFLGQDGRDTTRLYPRGEEASYSFFAWHGDSQSTAPSGPVRTISIGHTDLLWGRTSTPLPLADPADESLVYTRYNYEYAVRSMLWHPDGSYAPTLRLSHLLSALHFEFQAVDAEAEAAAADNNIRFAGVTLAGVCKAAELNIREGTLQGVGDADTLMLNAVPVLPTTAGAALPGALFVLPGETNLTLLVHLTDGNGPWVSRQPVTISLPEGGLLPGRRYIFKIRITKEATDDLDAFVLPEGRAPVPDAVDLGLSVKWASFNLGASVPEEFGGYYAWGEAELKTKYTWDNYQFRTSGDSYETVHFSKYNPTDLYGPADYKTMLDLEDDAARALLGDGWRMPTRSELQELLAQCTWNEVERNGVSGSEAVGATGGRIFFPYGGLEAVDGKRQEGTNGYYWNSAVMVDSTRYSSCDSRYGRCLRLFPGGYGRDFGVYRCDGCNIRPVYGPLVRVSAISLNQDSATVQAGGFAAKLTATLTPDNASEKIVIWRSSDDHIVSVDSDGFIGGVAPGTATVTATSFDGGFSASCTVTVLPPRGAVDLGLSVLWADCNLGADSDYAFGNYYAWGETSTKDDFSAATYAATGWSDAVPRAKGSPWRTPTRDEWQELIDHCSWSWVGTTGSGVMSRAAGFRVTSTVEGYTDQSIFLPACGTMNGTTVSLGRIGGYYWASDEQADDQSRAVQFFILQQNGPALGTCPKYGGHAIRPVFPK